MARALRVQYEGAIYHVTSRGNERRNIFRTDRDRHRFLEILAENVEAYHIRLYAYVLMSNHFHLLIETPRANLCAFMQQFNGAYTTWFNAKHKRSGHLYGGRYKARLVEGNEYLLALIRYVHLNPVKIKSVKNRPLDERRKRLWGYPWSSYRSYAGLTRKKAKMVDHDPLGELVGQGSRRKDVAYRRYVEAGLAKDDKELQEVLKQSSKAIGTRLRGQSAHSCNSDFNRDRTRSRGARYALTARWILLRLPISSFALTHSSLTTLRGIRGRSAHSW